MMSKLKKLISLIYNRGFSLRNPLHWLKLIRRGFCFFGKYGLKSGAVLREAYYGTLSTEATSMLITQTHAQVWERIKPTYAELIKMRWAIPNFKNCFTFSVIVPDKNIDTISSVEKQIYNRYEIIVGNIKEYFNATGDYVLFLQSGDFLHKNALFELNYELNRIDRTPPLLYFDHDYFIGETIDKPCYKPGWLPALLLEKNYINRACLFRRDLLNSIVVEDDSFNVVLYNIILRITKDEPGHHKPGILLTLSESADMYENVLQARVNYNSAGVQCDYFNPYLELSNNVYSEDPNPTLCRHIGSPTISPAGINKVIIVKLDHIGDVILAIPAIRKIRKILPNARIDILCGLWAKDLLELQPEIDNVFVYGFFNVSTGESFSNEREADREKIINALQKEKYDLAINLRKYPDTKNLSALLADYSLLLSDEADTDGISHSVPAFKRDVGNVIKWNIREQLLSLAGMLEYDDTLNREVYISVEVRQKVEQYINSASFFQFRPLIGIHAGSGTDSRLWPYEKFAELCNTIVEKRLARIILFGGESDIQINNKIIDLVKDKNMVMSVAGIFSLLEFSYFVKKIDYFIGNISGPAHVAGIQGVSTLVIFGSEHPSPEWMPIGKAVMAIERRMPCGPCYAAHLCENRECLTKIQSADVFAGLERLMILYPSKRQLNSKENAK